MIRYSIESYVLVLRFSTSSQIARSCDALWWSVEHLVAVKRRLTPQQVVAVEAETTSSALKKGRMIGALELHQPTSALKLITARGFFLDAGAHPDTIL